MKDPIVSFVVPTLGHSPLLTEVLHAIREDAGEQAEIILVPQAGATVGPDATAIADRILDLEHNLGFAGGTNAGIAVARGGFLATVNDDALIEPGWTAELLEVLRLRPEVASVQGINLCHGSPDLVDGAGLEWNSWWQAVQIGHGQPVSTLPSDRHEIFGVSATAAIYRRTALEHVGGQPEQLQPFDEKLVSYYEDVDLACRLRAAGFEAVCAPAARARHLGSVSGDTLGSRHLYLVSNRYLVLARHLGRLFFARLPLVFTRDLIDLARHPAGVAAFGRGWLRALRLFGSYSHFGAPRTLL